MADTEIAGMVVKLALESGSFNDQLKDINNDMKIVESEFKATGVSANNFGDSLEGLQANLKRCSDVLELQKKAVEIYQSKIEESEKRVEKLTEKHKDLASKISSTKDKIQEASNTYGESSKEVELLTNELKSLESRYSNNERALLNANSALKTNTVTYNNAVAKVKSYEQSINDTEQSIEAFGKAEVVANKATESFTTGIGVLDVAIGNLLSGGVQQLIEWFRQGIEYSIEFSYNVQKVAQQIQMTNDEIQKWGYAFGTVGLELEAVSGDLANFNEKIQDTVAGTGDGAEVFGALGISVQNVDGTLRNTGDVLQETVMKLQNMEDQTLRNSYASKLLSTTGEEMIPILNMTNEELTALQGKATIVNDDDIAALNALKQSLLNFMDVAGKPLIGILGDIAKILVNIVDLASYVLSPILGLVEGFTSVIGDTFGGVYETIDETNDKITDSNTSLMGNLGEGVDGLKDTVDEATGYITKALDNFYNTELSNYEKELRDQFGNNLDLADEKYIQRKVAKETARIEKEKQKELEKHQQMLEAKERLDAQYYNNLNNRTQGNATQTGNYKSYDTGTQYHLGGLAMVHKDELIDLPKGSKVLTRNQSNDLLNQNITNNDNKRNITIQNMSIQTNNVDDLLRQLEDRTRLL